MMGLQHIALSIPWRRFFRTERKIKCSAAAYAAFTPEAPAMPLHDARHRCQADAVADELGARMQPLKSLKQPRARGHVESRAVVPHKIGRHAVFLNFSEFDPRL